jgi:hypothetical protein
MLKLLLAVTILLSSATLAQDDQQGVSTQGGLTGFPYLPESRVLGLGELRVQGQIEWSDYRGYDDGALLLPVNVAWGVMENMEIGGEIPFYLHDPTDSDAVLGDMSVGCGWLYETARGGSSIVLRGLLRLPTGSSGRDRGSELELGVSTSTTFRLFRLQAAASYVLGGGDNPFEGDIEDYMRYSMGGASFVSEDVQVVFAMDGTTLGEHGISCTGVLYAFSDFALFGTLRAGLSGRQNASLSGGISWTGSGF